MGLALRSPVMTEVREKYGNETFRCGCCSINGFRDAMEDAHLIYMQPNWGFFGVFDGHVNDQCSSYLEGAWREELMRDGDTEGIPWGDEDLQAVAIKIDEEWLKREIDGGSTGTFFIARKKGDTMKLQVGNVGDSRVLAFINGECVSLTQDHKPNNEEERYRIECCGGRVENNRVDGSLAVSRAFGDQEYKRGGMDPLNRKVIAFPTVTHAELTCASKDFAVLCCDGVFESNFSNEEVIRFIEEKLQESNNLPEIAGLVCKEAITRGSRDNISCVIVQFVNGLDYATSRAVEVVPGPFELPCVSNFRKAYRIMAEKGHSSIGEVLEKRYDVLVEKELKNEISIEERKEMLGFRDGPPESLTGEERTKYFTDFFQELEEGSRSEASEDVRGEEQPLSLPLLLSLLQRINYNGPNAGSNSGANDGANGEAEVEEQETQLEFL